MTDSLERAISRIRLLPDDDQDAVAKALLSALDEPGHDAPGPASDSTGQFEDLRSRTVRERPEAAPAEDVATLLLRRDV